MSEPLPKGGDVSRTQELLKQAEEYFAQGDLEQAANFFEQAHNEEAATTKESPAGAIGMARVAIALGQFEDAMIILDKVLKTFPKSAEALNYRGVVDEAFDRLPAAIGWYEKSVKQDPKLAVARYNLGRAYGQMKRWKEAVRELQTATRQEPQNVPFWYALGIAYQESGDSGHAIEAFSECLELNPLFEDGYATLADILTMNDRTDLADDLLDKATALFPEVGVFHSKRAALAIRKQDYATAVEHLRRQCEVEPQVEENWLNLSTWAMMGGDLSTAEEGGKGAIAANPDGWQGYLHLGMVYHAVDLNDQAKEALRKAIANGADEWKPYNNLANVLLEDEAEASWREAVQVLERAIELAPEGESHLPLFNLALAHFKLGDKEKSKAAAQMAAMVGPPGDPTTENARKFLGNF
jgi:tetratricopeptide (TPR) repeat protein